MNTKQLLLLATLSSLSTASHHLSTAFAQGTAFTYQGRLNEGGVPANGVYDFTFQAFDAPSAGNSIGGTINLNTVGVTNGLFTALVNLGASPFTGPARWLQISVSTNGAGSFTTLVPRQALMPSPYAIYAHTAGTVTNGAITSAQLAANSVATGNIQDSAVTGGKIASGQVVRSLNGLTDGVSLTQGANVTINTVGNSLQISAPAGGLNLPFSGTAASAGSVFTLSNSAAGAAAAFLGRVGVGTTIPQASLHVKTPDEGIRIQGSSSGVANTAYMSFVNDAGTRIGYVGDGGGADNSVYLAADTGSVNLYTAVGAALTASPSGNVGIGTASPATLLHLQGIGPVAILQDTASAANQAGYVGFWNNASVETGWIGFGSPGSPHFSVLNARSGGNIALWAGNAERLTVASSGNVGVGTTTPTAKLDVRGDIRLGPSGQFRAVAGEENLRIIRGDIDGNGTITRGSGFTVSRVSEGVYDITFTRAFSGIPTIIATAVIGTGQPRWATSAEFFLSASTARLIMITDGPLTDSDFSICVIGPR